ncbi:MAG: hypothetical protein ACXADY_15245 [Candidatus Hodarchaeales archaeon]|jgi:membrane protein implicated in regulation of membrane protease activity
MSESTKSKERTVRSNDISYGSLSYIKNQRNYLIINAIVPIYCIIVQAFNLLFTLFFILRLEEIVSEFKRPRTKFFLIDALTPSLLFFVFIIFSIVNFIFLVRWRKKVQQYENQQQDASLSEDNVSLTQLFYDIIDIMDKLKIIFIVLNIFIVFYIQWFFRFFLNELLYGKTPSFTGFIPIRSVFMPWLNLILELLLLIYLVMNWRHFLRWNKKSTKLKDYEKQIYRELDLDNGILIVYGDSSELDEVSTLITRKGLKSRTVPAEIVDDFKRKIDNLGANSEEYEK